MNKSVVVLSVPHQVQGKGFEGCVPDPMGRYEALVENIISDGKIGFVFEEARGRKPSIAEDISAKLHGPDCYLDVSPPTEQEYFPRYRASAIDPLPVPTYCEGALVRWQQVREDEWVKRIESTPFDRGLLICGVCHNLSIANRLTSAGIQVDWTYSYIPYDAFRSQDQTGGQPE